MSDLIDKLERMAERSRSRGGEQLRIGLRYLADAIADALDDLYNLKFDMSSMHECEAQMIEGATLIDACDILEREVLADARAQDMKLPTSRTLRALQAFLDEEARSFAEEGGFVYLAWARNPDQYHYVGMSHNRDAKAGRLKLDARGKLLEALQASTVFSIIVPRREPRPIASDIEAAILAILDDNEQFPGWNARLQKVPSAAGTAHLQRVSDFLAQLGDRLRPGGDMITTVLTRS